MIKQVYAVRDVKTEIFLSPHFMHTHGEAERSFTQAVRDSDRNNPLSQFPNDYDLYHVGEYDDHNGLLKPVTPPTLIVNGGSVANDRVPQQNGSMSRLNAN